MRVPLPGRDYFPPRVLLRGATRAAMVPVLASGLDRPWQDPRGGLVALRPGPSMVPAWPPVPAIGMRPAAA
ncbi:hypothetical protein [Roseomonas sp. WA12]